MKGKVSGQSRVAKVRAAEDQVGKPPGGLSPGGQRAKSAPSPPSPNEREQVPCSEDLDSCGIGEKSYILIGRYTRCQLSWGDVTTQT